MQDQRASVVRDALNFHGVNYFTKKIEHNIVEDVLIVPEWQILRHACVGACTIDYSFFYRCTVMLTMVTSTASGYALVA